MSSYYDEINIQSETANRSTIVERFDCIPPMVTKLLAQCFGRGAKNYGEFNYIKSRLQGADCPINHALKHINEYQLGNYNEELDRNTHLIHAIANLCMEYHYESNPELYEPERSIPRITRDMKKEKENGRQSKGN